MDLMTVACRRTNRVAEEASSRPLAVPACPASFPASGVVAPCSAPACDGPLGGRRTGVGRACHDECEHRRHRSQRTGRLLPLSALALVPVSALASALAPALVPTLAPVVVVVVQGLTFRAS